MWTHIARDVYHQGEYFIIMGALFAGFIFRDMYFLIISWFQANAFGLLIYTFVIATIWYILGHFFWGKRYIRGEGRDDYPPNK